MLKSPNKYNEQLSVVIILSMQLVNSTILLPGGLWTQLIITFLSSDNSIEMHSNRPSTAVVNFSDYFVPDALLNKDANTTTSSTFVRLVTIFKAALLIKYLNLFHLAMFQEQLKYQMHCQAS